MLHHFPCHVFVLRIELILFDDERLIESRISGFRV